MEKKIPVKNLYLLLVISLGLIGLAIGSTYAVFTTSVSIVNSVTLSSNLTYDSDVIETVNVTVPAGKIVSSTLNITNSSGSTLNYAVWYLDEGDNLIVGTNSGASIGGIDNGSSTSVVIDIKNNSSDNVIVTIGLSSSSNNIVLSNNMVQVTGGAISSSSQFSYDNSSTGVNCNDVTCMLDELYSYVN